MLEIRARVGVGADFIYQDYPQRSHLIMAVFRRELDATAAVADRLGARLPPAEALRRWAESVARFVAPKRGFARALRSGNPAYSLLPGQLLSVLAPRLQGLWTPAQWTAEPARASPPRILISALSRLADSKGDHPVRSRPRHCILLDGPATVGSVAGMGPILNFSSTV